MKKLLLLAALCASTPLLAADNFQAKDGNAIVITKRAVDTGGGILADANVLLDTSFARIDPATKQLQQSMLTALGTPFQAGGVIGNTAFGISGTLPAFATTPTVNLGTLNGAALESGHAATIDTSTAAAKADLDMLVARTPAAPATAASQTAVQSALGTSAGTGLTVQGSAAGVPIPVDTVRQSVAADRGAIIGFTGATITTTASSTSITLVAAPTLGTVALGQQIVVTGAAFPAGTTLATLTSGTLGAAGSTYTTSAAAVNAVTAAAATSVGPQLLMASNAARRGTSYQVQSSTANVWTNGTAGTATADYHSLKVPANSYFESPPTHAGTGTIWAISDTPATPLYSREW